MTSSAVNFAAKSAKGVCRKLGSFAIRRDLRRKGLSRAFAIPTFTTLDELETLYRLAQQCPSHARVLEVGSYLGASTCYLAAGLGGVGASIVCVDTWQNETMPDGIRDTFNEFKANVRHVEPRLELIRKRSRDVFAAELGGRFDLIFLDGDHSYTETKQDFELFAPMLKEVGVLAFHDSLFFEGVSRVIGEALASGKWQLAGTVHNLSWIIPARFAHVSA